MRSGSNKSSRRPSDLAKKRKAAPAKRSVSLKSESWYLRATQAFGIRTSIPSPSIAPDGSATVD